MYYVQGLGFYSPIGEVRVSTTPPTVLGVGGGPESARLLDMSPGAWLWSLSRAQSIDVARQLHRDICLMTSNLNILELTLDQHDLDQSRLLLRCLGCTVLQSTWRPWASGGRPWTLLIVYNFLFVRPLSIYELTFVVPGRFAGSASREGGIILLYVDLCTSSFTWCTFNLDIMSPDYALDIWHERLLLSRFARLTGVMITLLSLLDMDRVHGVGGLLSCDYKLILYILVGVYKFIGGGVPACGGVGVPLSLVGFCGWAPCVGRSEI